MGLIRGQDGVAIGNFGSQGAYQDGSGRFMIGLLPNRINKDYLISEAPCSANTFLNRFLIVKRQ